MITQEWFIVLYLSVQYLSGPRIKTKLSKPSSGPDICNYLRAPVHNIYDRNGLRKECINFYLNMVTLYLNVLSFTHQSLALYIISVSYYLSVDVIDASALIFIMREIVA